MSGTVISLIGKKLKKQSTKAQEEQGIFLSIIEETLGGLKVVKGYNSEKYFSKIFQNSTDKFFGLSNTIVNRQNLASPLSEFMGIMVIAVLLWFGGHMVLIEHTLNGAAFITYMGLAYNILTPAKSISKASYNIKRGNAAAERILEILEQENPIVNKVNAIEKDDIMNAVNIIRVGEEAVAFNANESFHRVYDVLKKVEAEKNEALKLIAEMTDAEYSKYMYKLIIEHRRVIPNNTRSLRCYSIAYTKDSDLKPI